MTHKEFSRKSATLRGRITRLDNKVRQQGTLAEKLVVCEQRKQAREDLAAHLKTYFTTVTD